MDPKTVVRCGYDLVSEAYRSESFEYEGSGYQRFLRRLEARLAPGARVLDLGCGCGIPVAQVLSRRHRVLGVDISPVQIERARRLVPAASFRCQDITAVSLPPGSLEAVVAMYSIIHIPLGEQPAVLDSIGSWLVPRGLVLMTVGWQEWTGTLEDWQGVAGATMYWSHADAATYRAWMLERGFRILEEGFLPEGDGGHTVLLAQAPARGRDGPAPARP